MFEGNAYMTVQMKEIGEYQTKKNVDIETALLNWTKDFAERFKNNYETHPLIKKLCMNKCGNLKKCKGLESCPLTLPKIHEVLEDI